MGTYRLIGFGGVLGLLAGAAGFALGADQVGDWQLAARYTARISFLLFLCVYCMGPAYRLTHAQALRGPLRNRRDWGLCFAMAHGVHLAALVTFLAVSGKPASPVTLVLGGFGYAVLLALVLTSNDAAMKRLGAQWKRLHRFGIHYLWLIFTLTYLGRVTGPQPSQSGKVLLAFALAAAALRLAAFLNGRRQIQMG